MSTLRLLSVTARAVEGRDGLVELVTAHRPDLVAVHGAPHLVRWRQAVGAIARRCGLVVVGGGGREAGACLLLSSLGVDSVDTRSVRFTGSGGLHPAGATLAHLRWRGQAFVAVTATLIGNSAVRLGQARELAGALEALTPAAPPAVLSVEGTDRPGTAAYQQVVTGRAPVALRVFADPGIDAGGVQVLDGTPVTAPVLADLSFGTAAAER